MYPATKRILDFFASLVALILLSPFFLLISVIIKASSKGPAFFRQKRIGARKKQFTMIKFRTMRSDAPKDTPTHLLENPEQYVTKAGKFLRRYSLDELPQLINIVRGEMSFVGPRPALWNQFDLMAMRERHGADKIPPGLTGWAQVNGRDDLPNPVKAKYDGEYAEKMSFSMDFEIIKMTFAKVKSGEGAV